MSETLDFQVGESRDIFFAVCSHFLMGVGKEITDFVELSTWKSR